MMTCNEIYQMYQFCKPESDIHQAYREVMPDDRDGMYDNRTPLHLACCFADETAVRILLERGADANGKDRRGYTPLAALAATASAKPDDEERRASIAALLLEHEARISRSAPDSTALIMAVEHGHFKMASVIVGSGCRIDQTNGYGENVLHVACGTSLGSDSLDFVRGLLASGRIDTEEKNDSGKTAWEIAIEAKATKIAALLSGSNPDTDRLAALHGNMDVFQSMWHKNREALAALLESGAELQTVCGHQEMYDFYGKSPLACALTWFDESPEPAEMILAAGADPNYRFADGQTAFAVVAGINRRSSHTEPYTLLLKRMKQCGWDTERTADKEGNTALAVACRYASYNWGNAAIPFLLENGAAVNAVNRFGQTPLMLLYGGRSWDGHSPYKPYGNRIDGDEEAGFLERLLEAGADARRKDIWGNTLLHYIAASCHDAGARKTMDVLADFGLPDVTAVNNDGLTALDIAAEKDNEVVVKFLLKYS